MAASRATPDDANHSGHDVWATFAQAEIRLPDDTCVAGPAAQNRLASPTMWVVTAENPYGKECSDEQNRASTDRLIARLPGDVEWSSCRGGRGNHWEQSVLLGAGGSLEKAIELGRRHEQLAIFELTDTEQRIIDCATGTIVSTVARVR